MNRLLPPLAIPVLATLLTMNAFAAEKTIFDFRATTNAAAWQIVNDDVMGGVSASRFQVTNGVAVFRGDVSLDNNGGFASVRSLPSRLDLAGCDAFLIRVRGDGHRYKFTARTDRGFDSAIYQAAFPTKQGKGEEHRLPINEFVPSFRGRVLADAPPLDPAKVTALGFLIADKQAEPFRLEIAWIKAISGKP